MILKRCNYWKKCKLDHKEKYPCDHMLPHFTEHMDAVGCDEYRCAGAGSKKVKCIPYGKDKDKK